MDNRDSSITRAKAFLAGEALTFGEARALAKACLNDDHLSLARAVLARLRNDAGAVTGGQPPTRRQRDQLCTDEAILTSKDPELAASMRHDQALALLEREFGNLTDAQLDGQAELLGVAGGICKRRWQDLGQLADLKSAAEFYERGARSGLGDDAYCQINAAFLDDLLASLGDDAPARRVRANQLRERIIAELPPLSTVNENCRWWNAASRAEAYFGLGRYEEATRSIVEVGDELPAPWELESSVRQMAHLAQLRHEEPWACPAILAFFDAVVPGDASTVLTAVIGRVGLALSGGGFRASFYHLGVLARLAELDALRHLTVLSCVSGGSIVGACYWLMLRQRLQAQEILAREDYIALVQKLIAHFSHAVSANLVDAIKPSMTKVVWRLLKNERGALDPELAAQALDQYFYRPLAATFGAASDRPLRMDELEFQPKGHAEKYGGAKFQPGRHNWLRKDKVPVLVLNATTVNTGHAWQFTPTWMGESPWAVHEVADAIPRLEWAWYDEGSGWTMALARAVAASAGVPGVFAPLEIPGAYEGAVNVRLVDGGVHDNQGTVALLALDCNVVLVSDACGQLMFEADDSGGVKGLLAYGARTMNMLMERVRLANFADLAARKQMGLLSGLMFLHMKAGLDADVLRRVDSQSSYELRRTVLSRSGVRKDFQKALSELRTDLDAFSDEEQTALMACGYQMAAKAAAHDLSHIKGLMAEPPAPATAWVFEPMLSAITSPEAGTPQRKALLSRLAAGASVHIG